MEVEKESGDAINGSRHMINKGAGACCHYNTWQIILMAAILIIVIMQMLELLSILDVLNKMDLNSK